MVKVTRNTRSRKFAASWRETRRHLVASVSIFSLVVSSTLPAAAQVVTSNPTNTNVSTVGNTTTVTTNASGIQSNVAFNEFSQFGINAGDIVNMVQPGSTDALVNIINSGSQSQINGQLNALKNGATSGSNVFFVNPDGFVVGASGVINAGQLTMSAASADFVSELSAAAGGTSNDAVAKLFAGQEELGTGSIEIYGTINAEALDLRAGGRLLLDGSITIVDPDASGVIAPAVNTDDMKNATGLTVQGGVVRLFAEGDIVVDDSANVTAWRGSSGGAIQGAAGGDLRVDSGATIDVAGAGAGDAGSITLYTQGSAVLEAATSIDASAVSGAGGFVAVTSEGAMTANGDIQTGSASGTAGGVLLQGNNVTVTTALNTGGGDLAVIAGNTLTVSSNASINTRNTGANDLVTGDSIAASGDLLLFAPDIDVESGASLLAQGNNSQDGGLVALVARNITSGTIWAVNTDTTTATIDIDTATLHGGQVVVNAVAVSSNDIGAEDEVQANATAITPEDPADDDPFVQFLDSVEQTVTSVFDRSLDTFNSFLPLQIHKLKAEAKVTITDSVLTGDGNWKGAGITPTQAFPYDPDFVDARTATNGVLAYQGLAEEEYTLFSGLPQNILTVLPLAYDSTNDDVYVHAHAQTEVLVSPLSIVLGFGLGITDTKAKVQITDTAITSGVGDVTLLSTASERMFMDLAPTPLAGISIGTIVSDRTLQNQLLVNGGSINAARDLNAAAYTGLAHSMTNIADGYQQGWVAIALTISLGDAITEAALGGDIDAGGKVQLDAESIYFDKTNVTNAKMGLADPFKAALWKTGLGVKVNDFISKIRNKIVKDPTTEELRDSLVGGFAVDVTLESVDTYATLGGQYHDLSNSENLVALGTTTVDAVGAVEVNAEKRFAELSEGGFGITRDVQSAMGSIGFLMKAALAAQNITPLPDVTDDDLVGEYGYAVFLNAAISSMTGKTQAEVGSNATVKAASLDVNALTRYPVVDPVTGLKEGWESLTYQIANFQLQSDEADEIVDQESFRTPDIVTYLDPFFYFTSQTKAKAIAPTGKTVGGEQSLAIAISGNYFNTSDTTRAVIRSGANVDVTGEVDVSGLSEALFLHSANLPVKKIFGKAKTEDSAGGQVIVARAANNVEALIEGNAIVIADSITVDADVDVKQFMLTFAEGSAKGSSINGAIAVNILESDVTARASDLATLTATNDIEITAEDRSMLWGIAGAISKVQVEQTDPSSSDTDDSGANGVGASGVVNFSSRNIYAGIGPDSFDGSLSGTAGETRVSARNLVVNANNDGLDVSVTLAGAAVFGAKPADTPDVSEPDDSEDLFVPMSMMSADESAALDKVNKVDAPDNPTDDVKRQTGYAISGAVSLNLTLDSTVRAQVATNAKVDLTGDLEVKATNTSTSVSIGGALSVGLQVGTDTNALAGAFAVNTVARIVLSELRGAVVEAGKMTVLAKDEATAVGVAVGGAGTSRGDVALAGSVAINTILGGVEARVQDATITLDASEQSTVDAEDKSLTLGVGGAVGVNMSQNEGSGVGLGVAVNVVDRDALVTISGTSSITASDLMVSALAEAEIYGFGVSVGVGNTGFAGSITVNTITTGARAEITGTAGTDIDLDIGALTVKADEDVEIWSLAGAISRGADTAVGGGVAVNVVVSDSAALVEYVDLDMAGGTGVLTVDADATTRIGTLAAAGAAATDDIGVGVGLAANTITGKLAADFSNSAASAVSSASITADSGRTILSLGGGVAAAGRGAAGFASTVNLLLANDTTINLDGADIDATGAITAAIDNSGYIGSIAVAVSASKDTAIGGAATINISTGDSGISLDNAVLKGSTVSLSATDTAEIDSLGGAASGSSKAAVGAAVSVNVIDHDTVIDGDGAEILARTGDLSVTSDNSGSIDTIAVGVGASGNTAISGSVAVADIGNTAAVSLTNANVSATATGNLTVAATKSTDISILSGAASASGGNAFGAAISVASIHDTVAADLTTTADVTANSVSVTADNTATIEVLSVAGAAGGSATAAGSVVVTKIGNAPVDGPSVPEAEGDDSGGTPVADGQQAADDSTDDALDAANSSGGAMDAVDASDRKTVELTDASDITRAQFSVGGAVTAAGGVTVSATEDSKTESLAGALAAGGSGGIGAAVTVNLLYGQAEAGMSLGAGETTINGDVTILADQDGDIRTLAAAGAGSGGFSGAGSVVVNVMNREARAKLSGNGRYDSTDATTTKLVSEDGDISVRAVQDGDIEAIGGAASGGSGGFGGAVVVNALSDDAYADIENLTIDTWDSTGTPTSGSFNAGSVLVETDSTITLDGTAAAFAGGASGAFGGSFVINVADGSMASSLSRADVITGSFSNLANSDVTIDGAAGSVAVSGSASVGLAVVTNNSAMDVDALIDGSSVRGTGNINVFANADTGMGGITVSGAASGGVSVTGSAVSNVSENDVSAKVINTGAETEVGGSELVTLDSVLLGAEASTTIALLGGSEEESGLNLSLSVGAAGIGGSVTVNKTRNTATTQVANASRVVGMGRNTLATGTDLGTVRGTAIWSQAESTARMTTINGSAGGIAVSALLAFSDIGDTARVSLGGGTLTDTAAVNNAFGIEGYEFYGLTENDAFERTLVNAGQDTIVKAEANADISTFTGALAVAGGTGVGAAGSTALIASTAEVDLAAAQVEGADSVELASQVNVDLSSAVAGLAGGSVGVAASANVNIVDTTSRVEVLGSQVRAGLGTTGAAAGDLTMRADTDITGEFFVGGIAGGSVGAAGAVLVNVFEGETAVVIDTDADLVDADGDGTTTVDATGGIDIDAETDIELDNIAASGAGGAFGIALAGSVNTMKATTKVDIGAAQTLTADADLEINATESVDIDGTAGALAGGAVGAGGSLDYVSLQSAVDVNIGAGSRLVAGEDLTIAADAERLLSSQVVVASAGLVGVSAAVSVVEMGGVASDDDGDRNSLLGDVQSELNSDQDADNGTGSGGELAGYANAGGTTSELSDRRSALVADGAGASDAIGVTIGSNSALSATDALSVTANAKTGVTQEGGALSAGAVGIASGTVVGTVATGATVTVGNGTTITADESITLSAATGDASGRKTLDQSAATVAGGTGFSAGVGVAVAKSNSVAAVDLGTGVRLTGLSEVSTGALALSATRSDTVAVDVFNASVSGGLGVGVAVATASNEGLARVSLGGSGTRGQISATGFSATVLDQSSVTSSALGSSGGVLAGLNGVITTAKADGEGVLDITNMDVDATTVTLSNTSEARASAESEGVAAGAVAVGASVARASTDVTLTTVYDGGTIDADDISITTEFSNASGRNAYAWAQSVSGGILSGNGADARTTLDYDVTTRINGNLIATDDLELTTNASDATARAVATGVSGGIAAAGVVIAKATQDNGLVGTYIDEGFISGRDVEIAAANAPNLSTDTVAGSGGLVAGSSSTADVDADVTTDLRIGDVGDVTIFAQSTEIAAGSDVTVGAKLNNLNATLVGVSGAKSTTDIDNDVTVSLGGGVQVISDVIDIVASNATSRPEDGFNITSGSGGLVDVAAMTSNVTLSATTDLDLADGVEITQTGNEDEPDLFRIGIQTDIDLTDRLKLDAGGAIAVPLGVSRVTVSENDATLTVGDADLFAIGDMEIFNGGDVMLLSEVDSKSYGLAGAASSKTYATYNADHAITVEGGARVEALRDVLLKAGHTQTGVQSIDVTAEARVFNKTAIPINIDPVADALADTSSIVTIDNGAEILAVEDVWIFAEGGSRDITGYGRGKDLYREVAAAIANAFGSLVGADDVSLDIETGTSTDNANNGVVVNGLVRAGSRNQQILRLDWDNSVLEQTDGITFDIEYNVLVAQELQDRIDVLNGYLADSELSQNAGAVAAWQAERDRLLVRQASAGSTLTTKVIVDDVRAVEGNIYFYTDYVQGSSSGNLVAPGDALVMIESQGTALLETSKITIPAEEGGLILINDISVQTAADLEAQSNRAGTYAFSMTTGESSDDPLVQVATYSRDSSGSSVPDTGSIKIAGDIENSRGEVSVTSNWGDIDITADITASTISVAATNGDLTVGYIPGIRNLGGTPEAQYDSYFNSVQNRFRNYVKANYDTTWRNTDATSVIVIGTSNLSGVAGPTFSLLPTQSELKAGKNIFISADVLNINGLIQAGRGTYDVVLSNGIETQIAGLRAQNKAGRTLLHDPSTPVTDGQVLSAYITSDVAVYYNHDADQIEIDPMIVQGGRVEIVGNIISTGSGRIVSLDGFGEINVNSAATTTVALGRIDLGTSDAGGIQGIVKITDTGKTTASGDFLITEFRRSGGTLEVYDNTTSVTFTDDAGFTRVEPTNLVSSTSNRTTNYQPTLNRDYITLTAEQTVVEVDKKREEEIIIGVFKTRTRSSTEDVRTTTSSVELATAPYIGASLSGADYAYAVDGERIYYNYNKGPETKTHDSVKWWKVGSGWRHYEWTETTTTRQLYEHRLKADYPISIEFAGADAGLLNVSSGGDILFTETLKNQAGDSNITSTGGSIQTASRQVQLFTGNANFSAAAGSITGIDGALRVNQLSGSVLTATARDAIDIREMSGDLTVGNVTTTARSTGGDDAINGTISLQAKGTIAQSGSTVITGESISLVADEGGLGTSVTAIRVNTEGGTLTARARNDVFITETTGDLQLNQVQSDFGSVTLTALAGAILDRNNVETTDIRKEAELTELWFTDLGLDDDGRSADQIAGLKAEREATYRAYWADRTADGDAPQTYVLDADVEQAFRDNGWTDDMINAYVADRTALYDTWNGEASFDANYEYTPSAAEIAEITEGMTWTADELTRSIRAGVVRRTGDTVARVEDENILAAGDITLVARDGVGELLDPYVISDISNLTTEDLSFLATAESGEAVTDPDTGLVTIGDITIDETAGTLSIRRLEDVDFGFTSITDGESDGALTIRTTNNEIFVGAETAAALADVNGPADVQIRIDGNLTDAATGAVALTGSAIVLEAGDFGSIGTEADPLTVNVLAGGDLIARAGGDVYISAPSSNLPLTEIFAGGTASLSASGTISDEIASSEARIKAADITLNGGQVGASDAELGIELVGSPDGELRIISAGDAYVFGNEDVRLAEMTLGGGGAFTANANLALTGNNTISFGTTSTLALELAGLLDRSSATGTDVSGGTLALSTVGPIGSESNPLGMDIAALSIAVNGTGVVPIFANEADDLNLTTVDMGSNADSDLTLVAGGSVQIGTIVSQAEVDIDAAAITEGAITAERVALATTGAIGATSRVNVTTGALSVATQNGSVTLGLVDRNVNVENLNVGGSGALDVLATNAATTVLAGSGITTAGGAMTLAFNGLVSNADITSSGGTIGLTSNGDVQLAAGTKVDSDGDDLTVDVTGNLTAGAGVALASAAGNTLVQSSQASNFGNGASLSTTGGTLTVSAGTALGLGNDVSATATGAPVSLASGTSTTIGDRFTATGGSVALDATGALSLGNSAQLRATTGDLSVLAGAGATVGTGLGLMADAGNLLVDVTGAAGIGSDATLTATNGTLDVMASGNATIGDRLTATGDSLALDIAGVLGLGNTAQMRALTGNLNVMVGNGASIGNDLSLVADAGALTVDVTGPLSIGTNALMQTTAGPLSVDVDGNASMGAGYALTTAAQTIALDVTGNLTQTGGGAVASNNGNVAITVGGNALMAANSTVNSGTGEIDVDVTGNMQIGQFETQNATDTALSLNVGGTLTMAAGSGTALVANEAGALTTLQLGGLGNVGPLGLTTQVDRLTANVTSGDLHILETDALRLESASVDNAVLDIFAGGDLIVDSAAAGNGDMVLSSAANLRSDAASLTAGTIGLYAFGGAITGETGSQFTVDSSDGAELAMFASGNVGYRETAGDALIAYALSDTGSLDLDVDAGGLTVGLLGAAVDITLTANGDLEVARIGEAEIDLRNEVALQLVEPSRYGVREAASPQTVTLIAFGEGSALTGGLISAQNQVNLRGDIVTANLHDKTPNDGLVFTISDGQGNAADVVEVNTLGEGDSLTIIDPFNITNPDIATRDPATYVATLRDSFIGVGEVNHSGPIFLGENIVIEGNTYFRQGGFSLYAQTVYDTLSTVDTVQVLANLGGQIGFTIYDENILITENVLVLNRREEGVSVNGGQGFVYGVGVETSLETGQYGTFGDSSFVFRVPTETADEVLDLGTDLGLGDPVNGFEGGDEEEEEEQTEESDEEQVFVPLLVSSAN